MSDVAKAMPWDEEYAPRVAIGESLAQTQEVHAVLVTDDEHAIVFASAVGGMGAKMFPRVVEAVNTYEAHQALADLVRSIENDAEQVPVWLWGRIQDALARLDAIEGGGA